MNVHIIFSVNMSGTFLSNSKLVKICFDRMRSVNGPSACERSQSQVSLSTAGSRLKIFARINSSPSFSLPTSPNSGGRIHRDTSCSWRTEKHEERSKVSRETFFNVSRSRAVHGADCEKCPVLLVQLGGLEPPTSCSTDRRSNQLSYNCILYRPQKRVAEPGGN